MRIMVTGGAGYIGSHTVLQLIAAGHDVDILDNFCNSHREAVARISDIAGRDIPVHEVDIRDKAGLDAAFAAATPDAVIHFAGLKAVGESVAHPDWYYDNNVRGTLTLLDVMREHGCRRMVFSSSATVYGLAKKVPLTEDAELSATNPYGWTKFMIEQILRDYAVADAEWSFALLRYFNPVGAHESGRIGEDPQGIPNNLMPFIAQVACGRRDKLSVFGDDFDTPDGTGVRDYIHVEDLAGGHVKALAAIAESTGCQVWNLGTGKGTSVLELVRAFEEASGQSVPYVVTDRRPGDIAVSYAAPDKAAAELGWRAELGVDRMCADTWRWQSQNPGGYAGQPA